VYNKLDALFYLSLSTLGCFLKISEAALNKKNKPQEAVNSVILSGRSNTTMLV